MGKTRLQRPKTIPDTSPVTVRRLGLNAVPKLLREELLRLADGDTSRIEIVSNTEGWVR